MTESEPHKSVTWNVLIYESGDNTLYNMILVRYISNELKQSLNFEIMIIEGGNNR